MLIEGRFMSNLRTLLLLVIGLGTVQYLIGSYVLDLTSREPVHAPAKVQVSQDALISEDDISPSLLLSSRAEIELTSRTEDTNYTTTTLLTSKIEPADVTQNVQIVKIAKHVKKAKANVTVKGNLTTFCDVSPPGLGPFKVKVSTVTLLKVEEKYPEVAQGGHYKPPNCTARHKVAIIVPYRDRLDHLSIFLDNIHPFLMKQQIEYRIFIVEQQGTGPFNRGKLFNVGFTESRKLGFHCFVFHDVDLLPTDTRNMYICPKQPRHMSPRDDNSSNTEYFGSVNAMTERQFVKVNGFSNKYWNWGGEDEDMAIRLKVNNLKMAKHIPSISRYMKMIHIASVPSPKRFEILNDTEKHYGSDGLSSLEYRLVSTNMNHLYTHWMVELNVRHQAGHRTPQKIKIVPLLEK